MDIAKIDENISKLKSTIAFLESLKQSSPVTPVDNFQSLKEWSQRPEWPEAVDPSLIVNDNAEEDKILRAETIVGIMFHESLSGKTVLDFGCGEGHVAMQIAQQNAKMVVGYDPKQFERAQLGIDLRVHFTDSLAEVAEHRLYDIILLYDVLDHIVDEDPIFVMTNLRQLLKPGGKILARTHPWCSRHGTHIYTKLNKAFAHLVFTSEELKEMGLEEMPTKKIIHPLATYRDWFESSGLRVVQETPIRENVENFFEAQPLISRRIKANWSESHDHELRNASRFPTGQLAIQFADYLLVPA